MQLRCWLMAGPLLLFGGGPGSTREPPPIYDVPEDGRVRVTIDRRPVTAFAGAGMPTDALLSLATAKTLIGADADRWELARYDFSKLPARHGPGVDIGPTDIRGRWSSFKFDFGGRRTRSRGHWFEADPRKGANVLIGPYTIPHPVVRFALRQPSPGERVSSFPLAPKPELLGLALTSARFGGRDIGFAFSPDLPTTRATAAAASAILREFGGGFDGPTQRIDHLWAVPRPARPVRLSNPLKLGPIALSNLLARIADNDGRVQTITENHAEDPETAAEETVVVTGRRKGPQPVYMVILGADALGHCSSITFDKPNRRILLSCAVS